MKKKSLINKSLTQFIVCVAVLLALATPLFYLLTKNFYAEDMIDIIEAVQQGKPVPSIDLEEDIMQGIVIQFILICIVLGIAIILMMRFISKRLWHPFDKTLQAIESFRLEKGTIPTLPSSDVKEFQRLNAVLNKLMTENLDSYRTEKEFTENASHELQTPLAIFQSKLDILLQQPDITEKQAYIIQDLYQITGRLSRLNKNLLLLAKMENKQFNKEMTDIVSVLDELLPSFDGLSEGLVIQKRIQVDYLPASANRSLLECMINNLIVNAIRHNIRNGTITVTLDIGSMTVSNTSAEEALDGKQIFNRFYHPSGNSKGNGLGLAIVKAVCEYHGWSIAYEYHDGLHCFIVTFK